MKTKTTFFSLEAWPFVLLGFFCRPEAGRRRVKPFTSQFLLLAATLGLMLAGTVQAQLINVDFNTNSAHSYGGGPPIGPTMTGAAVLGAAGDNWNGIDITSGAGIPLTYANGGNSPVTMTFTSGGGYDVNSYGGSTPFAGTSLDALMEDYLYNGGVAQTVTLSGLAPSSKYDLVLYNAADVYAADRTTYFTVNSNLQSSTWDGSSSTLVAEVDYVEFTSAMSDSSGTLVITWIGNGTQEGDLDGFQILGTAYQTATVVLSNLVQNFDLTAKSVSVTTVPPGLSVTVTYNGSTSAPTNVGSYTVTAVVNSAGYQGGATNTLQIELLRNFGVDASHYQNSNGIPETNWAQIYAEGQRFAYVKASEGLTGPDDPTMGTNVANAIQAGLLVGVYHFAHPENRPTTNGAVVEADHFLRYAGSAIGPGMLRPVLDIETGAGTLSASAMTDWVLAFSQELVNNRGTGAAPIVYCTSSYAAANFDSRLAGHALWVEAGGGDLLTNGPSSTGVFTNWAFWQYNLSGSAGGISPIDLDVCHDDVQPISSYVIPALRGSFGVQSPFADSGGFHISLTNVSGLHFTVLTSTNMATPLTNWTVLGATMEISAGQYQFTDPPATNLTARFYRLSWP